MNSSKKTASIKKSIMKNKIKIGLVILSMIFLSANISAKPAAWKTKTSRDGKIKAEYRVSNRTDENGDVFPLLEYIAVTTVKISMQNCISLMEDVSKHKDFQDDDVSKKIKTISDNESVVYYYTKGFGSFSDTDCVATLTSSEDTTEKTIIFTLTAAPSLFEETKAKRFTCYNVSYAFKDLENGEVEITLNAKMSPPMKVSLWMVRFAFPDIAYDQLRGFVKLAKKIKK